MKKIRNLIKKASLFLTAVFLIAGISSESVFAAAPGIYIADCTPSYRHPQTGVIEDAGGESSYALGQSMTEGVTGRQALVEVDEAGNTYVTVRLSLMDNISDVSFLIDGGQASPELIQQDTVNHTADYRMLVFSESSIITASLYVEPMGRYVTYYMTFSNLQSGSGNFVPQITVAQAVEEPAVEPTTEPTAEPTAAPTEEPTAEPTTEPVEEATAETITEPLQGEDTEKPEEAAEQTEKDMSETETEITEDKEDGGLQEFDAEGNKVEEKKEESEAVKKPAEKKSHTGMWIGIVLGVVVVAGGVWYFLVYKKRK